eukprot:CAMPEP_0119554300 /NCGR_PEP_ID=MMETSP1352-20130426/6830_1 /TAXON_ID=265584 /ORGANISM="Stauroneis constricta, Strain CCMP1120" /LENGTH=488 /DNA_ID=CAMNT_0007600873 /DNA_START=61 /DNA_END=1526 /DNA_ORIENTATION=+
MTSTIYYSTSAPLSASVQSDATGDEEMAQHHHRQQQHRSSQRGICHDEGGPLAVEDEEDKRSDDPVAARCNSEYDCSEVSAAVAAMRDALRDLPMTEKDAYLEAKNECPDVVKAETPYADFVKHDGLNAKAAALRLCRYWKVRRQAFGDVAAFLPMSLHGAMRESQDLLLDCNAMILPNDDDGRGVLFIDGSMPFTQDECAKLLLFFTHRLKQQESVVRNGWALLLNVEGCDENDEIDRSRLETIQHICSRTLTIRNHGVHLFLGDKAAAGSVLPQALQDSPSPSSPSFLRIVFHRKHPGHGYNKDSVLQSHGLNITNLSTVLGGEYTSDQFLEWLASLEWDEKRQQNKLREHMKLQIAMPKQRGQREGWSRGRFIPSTCLAEPHSFIILTNTSRALSIEEEIQRQMSFLFDVAAFKNVTPPSWYVAQFHNNKQRNAFQIATLTKVCKAGSEQAHSTNEQRRQTPRSTFHITIVVVITAAAATTYMPL